MRSLETIKSINSHVCMKIYYIHICCVSVYPFSFSILYYSHFVLLFNALFRSEKCHTIHDTNSFAYTEKKHFYIRFNELFHQHHSKYYYFGVHYNNNDKMYIREESYAMSMYVCVLPASLFWRLRLKRHYIYNRIEVCSTHITKRLIQNWSEDLLKMPFRFIATTHKLDNK